MRTLSTAQARRIALGAQGLDKPRPRRADLRTIRRELRRLGLLQIDSVNVLCRAHYMPIFSRLGPYDRGRLDALSWGPRPELFEYWGHECSLLTLDHRPLLAHRMDGWTPHPRGRIRQLLDDDPGYVDGVLDEVRARGPLAAGDLDDPGQRSGHMWSWNKGKAALEWHFARGALAAIRRPDFTRVYGLPEQLLPADAHAEPPSPDDARRALLVRAARLHGVAGAAALASAYRLHGPTARRLLDQLAATGALERVRVEGLRQPAYLHPEARRPRTFAGRALLSPFDPLMWDRDRVERLFDFRYRIEIYVPREQRTHGYYVLPFLLGEHLVARVDLKADRAARSLRVHGAWLEAGDGHPDRDTVARALADELATLAQWLDLERVVCGRKGDLIRALRRAM